MRRALTLLAVVLSASLLADSYAGPKRLKKGGKSGAALLLDCPMASGLTCGNGETLTFTRSTVGAACMTTGLTEDTLVTEPATNTACINDVHGIRVVGAIKNELGGSETFNDSVVDWLPTVGAAAVTLGTDDSPLSGVDTLSDTIDDDSAVTAEHVRQVVSLSTAGMYRLSVWLRTASAHGATLEILNNDAVSQDLTTCDVSVATTYKRFDCAVNSQGSFSTIEVRIYPADSSAGGNTGAVFAWGAQLEGQSSNGQATFRSPYCRSTGASATTCTPEKLLTPSGEFPNVAGAAAVDMTPIWASNVATFVNGSANTFLLVAGTNVAVHALNGVDTISSNDGTTVINLASAWSAFVTTRLGLTWKSGIRTLKNITAGTQATGTFDGTWSSTTLSIGADDSLSRSDFAYHKHLQIYSKPTTRGPAYTALLDCSLVSDSSCLSGDTLTFTRSTVGALCPSTGDEDANVTEPAVDTACHHPTFGVRVAGAVKNELARSEDFGTTWVADNVTVTIGQLDAPLSGVDTIADKVDDQSAGVAGRVHQTVSLSTQGKYYLSAWACSDTARSVTVLLSNSAGTNSSSTLASLNACGATAPYAFKRISVQADWAADTFTSVTSSFYATNSGTPSATGAIYLFGAQLQGPASGDQGKFLAPYCRSTGAGATTCTAEVLTAGGSGNFNQGGGSWSADVTPFYDGAAASPKALSLFIAGDGNILYRNSGETVWRNFDGTTPGSLTISPWAVLTTKTIATHWRNTRKSLRNVSDASLMNSAFDGQWSSVVPPATLYLGADGSGGQGWAYFKNWRIHADADPIP